ncbi:hypothetical protein RUM43_011432 [Polyplax serrata]|uniref:Uncharacterized protein n=1 Tax=Polyplax serrata TaxID=468196 RepID=A0AAN8P7F9_POLSC
MKVASIIALAVVVPALALPQGYGNQQNQFNQQRGSRYNQQEPLNYDDYEAQGSARQSSQQRNNQQFNTNQLFNNNNNNNNQQYDNNQDFGRNSNSNSNSNDGFTRKAQNDFRSDNSGNFRSEQTTFIPIIRFDKEQTLDGSYKTSWETGNNIVAEETGVLKNFGGDSQDAVVQQGSFSYTSPEGTLITVQYTADEQGFRATGDHLPTPPPIPAEIQKGLDIIYAGIKQQEQEQQRNPQQYQQNNDGQYRQSSDEGQYQQNSNEGQYQQNNSNGQFQQNNFQRSGSSGEDFSSAQGSNINFRNSGERITPGRRNEFRQYGQ